MNATESSRFSHIEVDDAPPAKVLPVTPEPTPAPKRAKRTAVARKAAEGSDPELTPEQRAATFKREGADLTQADKAANIARAEADFAAAVAAGFAPPRTVVPFGEPVMQIGRDNFKRSRQDWEQSPKVADAVKAVCERIASEKRADAVLDLGTLRMTDAGEIRNAKGGLVTLDTNGYDQLIDRLDAPAGAGPYLRGCDTHLRSFNANAWLDRAKGTKARLRTRQAEGGKGRECYAVVSEKYSCFDADKVAQATLDAVKALGRDKQARATWTYDGQLSALRVMFHSPIKPEQCVAGEIFRAGVLIETADDGTYSVRGSSLVERNLCRNVIIIGEAKQTQRTRHVGNVGERIKGIIETALKQVEGFAEQWTAAAREQILESGAPPSEVFGKLVEQGLVAMDGYEPQDLVERLERAYWKEPTGTKAGLVNAITRAAHEETWDNPWASTILEEQAGELLYNRLVLSN